MPMLRPVMHAAKNSRVMTNAMHRVYAYVCNAAMAVFQGASVAGVMGPLSTHCGGVGSSLTDDEARHARGPQLGAVGLHQQRLRVWARLDEGEPFGGL